ncbi:MAG: aminoacyl-tRNA hydrolase [Minwuia sp.]|uniref:aminoacyl-tRNA hydrolase n=1 Tax=Minwuia sp. TaxID=2493630 RepID=UPI003A89322B
MLLFVGLGNPGREYALHRHNAGFMAIDRIAADHGFGAWKSKFQGAVAEGRLGGHKVMLLKPATFMNRSGQSVAEAMRFHKLSLGDVTVFHDELDVAFGKVKVKTGGGHAGNNGIRSIAQHITPEFQRVRIGIGHPGDKARVTGHVLGAFSRAEQPLLTELMDAISYAAPKLAEDDAPGFLTAVALKCPPPKPAKKPKNDKPDTEEDV